MDSPSPSPSFSRLPVLYNSKPSTLHAKEDTNDVEIFEHNGDSWNTIEQSVEDLVEQDISRPSIIFASTRTFQDSSLLEKLSSQFHIPHTFWTKASSKAAGYFGCYDTFDQAGNVISYNLWLRFIVKMMEVRPAESMSKEYYWEKIKVFTKFQPLKSDIMICFDTPPSFKDAIKEAVIYQYLNFEKRDPFLMPSIVIGEVVSLFDISVWTLRDLIRTIEQTRADTEHPEPDFYHMHEISRHVIHSSETLVLAVKTLDSMMEQHKAFLQDESFEGEAKIAVRVVGRNVQQSLLYQKSLLQCIKGRSEGLGLRLQNEINLAFNTVAQHDSKLAVKVGKAAQADSASMRAISVLSFLFFPGTFISSILGMTFFNFSPGDNETPSTWSVSNKLWIFFAITIPLTVATGIAWLLWERKHRLPLRESSHADQRTLSNQTLGC